MKIIVSHPTGNQFVRALLRVLEDENNLARFNTTIAVASGSPLFKLFPASLRKEFERRSYSIRNEKIKSYPVKEMIRLLIEKSGLQKWAGSNEGHPVDKVYYHFDKIVGRNLQTEIKKTGANVVYAFEDGAFSTFTRAKSLGLKCVYDLPIAYWATSQQLLREERELNPQWACTLENTSKTMLAKSERKNAELAMADEVIVPSYFVKESLPTWATSKKVTVAPFGSPLTAVNNEKITSRKKNKNTLRILFAGSMTQRKGLGYLFDAVKSLNTTAVELVVMGSPQAPMDFYKSAFQGFTYEKGRPHQEVLQLMNDCDILCMPSIVEGRALVMQEAMSQSLPIIITPNTGGSDLVIAGETGFMIPIRSSEAIAEKINWFLENKQRIPEMGKQARQHAATYTWENYARTISDSIKTMLEPLLSLQ